MHKCWFWFSPGISKPKHVPISQSWRFIFNFGLTWKSFRKQMDLWHQYHPQKKNHNKTSFILAKEWLNIFFFLLCIFSCLCLWFLPVVLLYYIVAVLSHGVLFIIFLCLSFWIFPVRRKKKYNSKSEMISGLDRPQKILKRSLVFCTGFDCLWICSDFSFGLCDASLPKLQIWERLGWDSRWEAAGF